MLAKLSGKAFPMPAAAGGQLVVEAGGVGWRVHTTPSTYERAVSEGRADLWVSAWFKGDSPAVYGFETEEELLLFEKLVSVSGVGPRTALALLSVFSPKDLERIIGAGDSKALLKAPGVGRKTADRIVLELKGALPLEEAEGAKPGFARDAVSALVNLGFSKTLAEEAVMKAISEGADGFQSAVKKALAALAGRK